MPPEAAPETTVLAFDFGTRRIGVAVGNTLVRVAHPLDTLEGEGNAERFAAIARLIGEWQPGQLVVGVPVHVDGTEHSLTARARRFARQLAGRFSLPVAEVDERYTTEIAQSMLDERSAGRRGRDERDAIAAQLILQGYFNDHRPG